MSTRVPHGGDRLGRLLYYGALGGLLLVGLAPLVLAWWASSEMLRPFWYTHPGPNAPLAARYSLWRPRCTEGATPCWLSTIVSTARAMGAAAVPASAGASVATLRQRRIA